jgi:hypothetical protein
MPLRRLIYRFAIWQLLLILTTTAEAQFLTQPISSIKGGWGQNIFQYKSNDSMVLVSGVQFDFSNGSRQSYFLSNPTQNSWRDLGKMDSVSFGIQIVAPYAYNMFVGDSFALFALNQSKRNPNNQLPFSELYVYRLSLYDSIFEVLDTYKGLEYNVFNVFSTVSENNKTYATGSLLDTALWAIRIGNISDNYLVRFDSLGQIDLEIVYGGNGYDQANSILPQKDGGCLISSVSDVDTTNGILFQGLIYKMDSDGQQTGVFAPRPPRPGFNMRIFLVGETPDGGFLLRYDEAGIVIDGDDPFYHYIVKVDSIFEVLWEKEVLVSWNERFIFNGYGIYGGLVNQDGSALMCGSHIYDSYGWVGKLNQAGNYDWRLTLWQHPGLDSSSLGRFCIITDCIEKPGGGWWCTGSAADSTSIQKAFLLSIDSSGCVDQFCPEILSSTEYFTPTPSRVLVYPNPATNRVRVQWEGNSGGANTIWELHSLLGQTVVNQSITGSETEIILPALPPGLYTWTLRSPDKQHGSGKLVVE